MAELKTKPSGEDVEEFLANVEPDWKQVDCRTLVRMMTEATGEAPRMWADGVVGFGDYHYRYASGREGDWFLAGFAPRKANLTIYMMAGFAGQEELLARLGKHKTSIGCLYVKRLTDINVDVLADLVRTSIETLRAGASSG